jgi:hypothetical protein
MKTIKDMLEGGNMEKVIEFLKTKNLFNQNVFNVEDILGLMKNE